MQWNINISEDYNVKKSIFEQMGGTYCQQGDYLLPALTIPETISIGIWGQRHLRYIKEHRRTLYTSLWLSGKLNSYLVDIDQQAEEMFSHLVTQISERESITEQFKTENQIGWIRGMNNIKNRVI